MFGSCDKDLMIWNVFFLWFVVSISIGTLIMLVCCANRSRFHLCLAFVLAFMWHRNQKFVREEINASEQAMLGTLWLCHSC